ncbi:MAG TPA: vWA domain-containing protein [Polyangiaceae bacterium]
MFRRAAQFSAGALALSSIVTACGDDDGSEFEDGVGGSSAAGGTINGSGGTIHSSGGTINRPDGGGGSSASGGAGGACGSAKAEATRQPVFLAFAFDVSASMGSTLEPYYRKDLKWDPVRAAAQLFFNDSASAGLNASMTFFPGDNSLTWCTDSPYRTPNVPMTALPSTAFATALNNVEPQLRNRTATPTLGVMTGVIAYVNSQRAARPGQYAIVLVTDGYPQRCPELYDPIPPVVTAARNARTAGTRTYVIGVRNPPIGEAPTSLDNLNQIALAGGTNANQGGNAAYLIATSATDANATVQAFRTAVNEIRGQAVSCNLRIPAAPPGKTFDKRNVRVLYGTGTAPGTALTYDQTCAPASANAWQYNNPTTPTEIVLCPSTCRTVQANPQARIDVEFTCTPEIEPPPE